MMHAAMSKAPVSLRLSSSAMPNSVGEQKAKRQRYVCVIHECAYGFPPATRALFLGMATTFGDLPLTSSLYVGSFASRCRLLYASHHSGGTSPLSFRRSIATVG